MIYPVFGKLNVSFPLKILGLDVLVLSSYRVGLNHLLLEGPFLKPNSTFYHINWDANSKLEIVYNATVT